MRRECSTAQKKMEANKSSSSFCFRRNVCHCGGDVVLMTSKTVSNSGKKFWRKSCCGYFDWADEETVDGGRNEEDVEGYKVEIMELKMKLTKVQKKLNYERNGQKCFIVAMVLSWAMTIILCVFFSLKCVGCRVGF
ncbi:Zinc finger, GRF-type [Sesbania bispinosa]|nr:Zinc finger, GRF-type [Sesbania bispinosa]